MGECEICGAATDALYGIEIEGAQMLVCGRCAKGKDVAYTLKPESDDAMAVPAKAGHTEAEEELVEDYGTRIRKAREDIGLPLKVLGERINEKESTLARVEQQKTLPTKELTRKLERELGIKLVARVEPKGPAARQGGNQEITLGDAAFRKDEKRQR